MLKLEHINLVRTNAYYRVETFRSLFVQSLMSPLKSITEKPVTEFFLKDINIEIRPGERIAFLGRNGGGKSTLCRLVAGQLMPSSGTIGNDHRVSLFSQLETSFYRELTGRENLRFFMKFIYRDCSDTEQARLLAKAEEFSELGQKLDRAVETYSTGMISRLALSLILARPHDLLILDEMQNYADAPFRAKVAERLSRVIESSNIVIVVSHHEDDLVAVCTRGVVIEGGSIVFDGPIEKAKAFYKLTFPEVRNA